MPDIRAENACMFRLENACWLVALMLFSVFNLQVLSAYSKIQIVLCIYFPDTLFFLSNRDANILLSFTLSSQQLCKVGKGESG